MGITISIDYGCWFGSRISNGAGTGLAAQRRRPVPHGPADHPRHFRALSRSEARRLPETAGHSGLAGPGAIG
jgi:hypothetical protein